MSKSFDDPLAKLSGKTTVPKFDAPTDALAQRSVCSVKSKNTTKAGRFQRKTVVVLPEQVDYIAEIAKREGVGKMAMWRWVLDQGLLAYEDGARPEKAEARATARDVVLYHDTAVWRRF